MSKLWINIAKMRAETGIKINDIAEEVSVWRQTVSGWKKRRPQKHHAIRLVNVYSRYITMKDCGY